MEFNATFIASAISFIVFSIIMNAIFYKPLGNIVVQRQKFIDETLEEAKAHSAKSQLILRNKKHKLDITRQDAKKIILTKSDEAKAKKAELAQEAQQKASVKIEEAKGELYKSKDEAQGVLSEEVNKLAQDISAKILGQV